MLKAQLETTQHIQEKMIVFQICSVAKVVFLQIRIKLNKLGNTVASTQHEGQTPVLDAKHTSWKLLGGFHTCCALKTESLCQPLTKPPKPAASGSREVTWNQGYTQNKKKPEIFLSQITPSFLIP